MKRARVLVLAIASAAGLGAAWVLNKIVGAPPSVETVEKPRGETPRPGERRDVVWGYYVRGKVTGSDWAPDKQPLSERATTSDVSQIGGGG